MRNSDPKVEQLFHAALEQPTPARGMFLDHACRGDPALRAEVESLLQAFGGAETFIETPAISRFPELIPGEAGTSWVGRRVGAYRLERIIACGAAKVIGKIARDGADTIRVEARRTLAPVLSELKRGGYQLVGLEQTTGSESLHAFRFERKTVLVVGNERAGLGDDVLALVHHAVEIPVYGLPYSYNVATAVAMALYEYCRQYPAG